ncbi:hypothetical protein ACOME3_008189 [Neoechinorhynchus agilis]
MPNIKRIFYVFPLTAHDNKRSFHLFTFHGFSAANAAAKTHTTILNYRLTETMTSISSEVAKLKRLFIHGLDESIEKMIPLKAQECLFEDIIDVNAARDKEYSLFTRILLFFLDEDHARFLKQEQDAGRSRTDYANPFSEHYFRSDKLVDVGWLLQDVLGVRENRVSLLNWILASEGISHTLYDDFLNVYSDRQLARTLLSGCSRDGEILFRPIPNLIMVRDIAVFVNDHIIICQPAKLARRRETVIFHFIVKHHPFFEKQRDKVIWTEQANSFLSEGTDEVEEQITMEGGDFMMVAPNHLLIGISERTTLAAARSIVRELFEREVVEKVSLIFLPKSRYCMHLDTLLTQAERGLWIIFGPLANRELVRNGNDVTINGNPRTGRTRTHSAHYPEVLTKLPFKAEQHFIDPKTGTVQMRGFDYIFDLLKSVSQDDLKSKNFDVVFCADDEFPDNWREQWTDGCNTFAVKEGVIFMYDRNRKTIEAFKKRGFKALHAAELLTRFDEGLKPNEIERTVIVLPSSEISRARGGPHCMTLPIEREPLEQLKFRCRKP